MGGDGGCVGGGQYERLVDHAKVRGDTNECDDADSEKKGRGACPAGGGTAKGV